MDSNKKCQLRPHLSIENCTNFDKILNECLECAEGYVLDSDLSPYCAWNRQKATGDINAEKAVLHWGNIIFFNNQKDQFQIVKFIKEILMNVIDVKLVFIYQ